ncbi:MAG: hypothetical protein DRR16_01340 [Candidatus Parabeggiatoa sp. nov. 3]|nr:MAG: hypothetical protein DRR00_02030 [Gammaproteobacteria bacterium]RKZ69691.1 MAG: hypothetical protein DRQ99_00415 [Gammaproteobacteria bacterium]RKZ89903.1 MAG: hypothetical protein DRR16_01340 [Gammaproteobacteria bacterium]
MAFYHKLSTVISYQLSVINYQCRVGNVFLLPTLSLNGGIEAARYRPPTKYLKIFGDLQTSVCLEFVNQMLI